jgi:hypothetical protein
LFAECSEYYFEIEKHQWPITLWISIWNTIYNFRAMLLWEMGQEDAALDLLTEKVTLFGDFSANCVFVGRRTVTRHAEISCRIMLPSAAYSYLWLEFQHEERYGIDWQYALRARVEAEYALRQHNDVNSAIGLLTYAIEECEKLVTADRARFQPHLTNWIETRSPLLEAHVEFVPEPEPDPAVKAALKVIEDTKEMMRKSQSAFPRRSGWPSV